ncbi:DUF3885 domain-containing protein [Hazenella sp. IB182353]|uniref:DUF3885 domain-containing protein n=1 Tax=Polycladospora coralii TaxID=2771432 RepID=UPI0017461314|nr:DUF3885 domain-containing protein [Polycladospora coralii]MBS7531047.1 DUF3885 domain-containing protein [Polycladospora coralii]
MYNSRFEEYFSSKFPKRQLKKPLFYNFPYGLRFDLKYYEMGEVEGCIRSKKLFEAVHSPDDSMYLITFVDQDIDESKIDCDNVILDNYNKYLDFKCDYADLNCKQVPYRYYDIYDELDEVITYRYDLSFEVSRFNYEQFINEKIYGNYYGDMYIINQNKDIIFDLYDRRGVDIISKERNTLLEIYHKFNVWILDHDREKIDNTFKL